jgi:uncharacterized protein HemY
VLGHIAYDRGDFQEAETRQGEALLAFQSMEGRYDVARVHLDLARLAHARHDRAATGTHLREAHRRFRDLEIPRYVERIEKLAAALEVPLAASGLMS